MISTYLGYELYARDLTKSQQRIEDEATVKTAKAYYDANIGKVKTVDDFINNFKLFSYAMKAYGLQDLTFAKGLIRQVLTSDITDPKSVANRLSDTRYLAFARAFNFTTAGAVAPTSVQSAGQQSATVAAFKANTSTTLSSTVVAEASTYFQSHIGAVTSIAGLEQDQKLFAYELTAYGLDPTTSKATFEAVVAGRLSDPTSLVNTTAGAGYGALSQTVNVSASGTQSIQALPAQTDAAIAAAVTAYGDTVPADTASRRAAKAESTYYASTMPTITSVDDLLKDSRLVPFVIKAYGLPSSTSATLLRQVLTSDASDPTSLVNRLTDPSYKVMASAFNFGTDGALKTEPFQTATQQQSTVALYLARQTTDTTAADTATQYYEAHIGSVKTVADLENDSSLLKYVLTAYGVASTTPQATIENVLEASASDPTAAVNQTPGAQYLALEQAFTVDAKGAATNPLQAQTADAVSSTTAAYMSAAGSDTVSQASAKAETAYYKSAIATVPSVGAFLSDPRLVAYVTKAYGLPASTTSSQLRQVLTSDSTTTTSIAARLGGGYKQLAAAFSFDTTGLIAHQPVQRSQSTAQQTAVDTAYARQTMEDEAGSKNTGVKLALYFQRVAPTITSGYSILADKALMQVFQTMLGLPAAGANMDVDVRANYLKSKLNFADFKNPAKVTAMVQRFAAQYDMANPDSTTSNQIAMLFGAGTASTGTGGTSLLG